MVKKGEGKREKLLMAMYESVERMNKAFERGDFDVYRQEKEY
jgi:hypothetical protein